jgi:hypothetical protein
MPSRRRAIVVCVSAGVTMLLCAALVCVAVLLSAPPAALPFVVAIGVGCPVWAAWELSPSIAVLRRARRQRGETLDLDALEEMRRHSRGCLRRITRSASDAPVVG